MEESILSKISSEEPRTDDCFEHIMRREIGNAFYGRANGDDAGYEEPQWIDEELEGEGE